MSFLGTCLYDRVMKASETACLSQWRESLLTEADGKVLEIGAGTGASIDSYPEKPSLELYLLEPDRHMRKKLVERLKGSGKNDVKVLDSAAEHIDAKNDFFDYVFVSLVCCSVDSPAGALKEIKRVLKPSGKLIFREHVAAQPGSDRRKWQDRLNGMWGFIAGNCHLNRETEKEITEAGFVIQTIQRESMP